MTTITTSELVLNNITDMIQNEEYDFLCDHYDDDFIAVTVSLVNIEIDIRLEGDNGEDKGLHIHVGGLDDDTILFDGVFYTGNIVEEETKRLYEMFKSLENIFDK